MHQRMFYKRMFYESTYVLSINRYFMYQHMIYVLTKAIIYKIG